MLRDYLSLSERSGSFSLYINSKGFPVGEYVFWVRVTQARDNLAYLEINLAILDPVDVAQFAVVIEEETEEEETEEELEEEIPPPEPEPVEEKPKEEGPMEEVEEPVVEEEEVVVS